MLMIHYCEECRNKLVDYGEIAYHIYTEACEYWIYNSEYFEMFAPSDCDLKVLSFLESKGYMISTECSQDLLKIKPLGIVESEMNNEGFAFYICFDTIRHKFVDLKEKG